VRAGRGAQNQGGEFIGPDGFAERRGNPTRGRLSGTAADPQTGRRLWELSEERTGVSYDALPT